MIEGLNFKSFALLLWSTVNTTFTRINARCIHMLGVFICLLHSKSSEVNPYHNLAIVPATNIQIHFCNEIPGILDWTRDITLNHIKQRCVSFGIKTMCKLLQ